MLKIHYHKKNTWFDFTQASKDNFHPLAKKKKINPYIIKKFLSPSNRDKALHLDDNLYLSLHFPDLKNRDYISQEIKFIIGRDYIITNQDILNEGLDKFRYTFEKTADFEKNEGDDSCIVYIFLHMMEKIYENIIFELRDLEKRIDKIEDKIFDGKEKYMVRSISETNRDLLDFKKNIKSHRETWNIFFKLSREYFEKESSYTTIESILISYKKTHTIADELSELIHDLRDTNNSLLAAKQGDMTKTFTLIAFLTMPATLFYSIVALPTTQKHIFIGQENDFTLIMILSFGFFIVMLSFTIWKKWW